MSDLRACSRSGLGFAAVCGLAATALTGAVVADGGPDPFSPTAIGALPFSDTGDTTGGIDNLDAVCPYTGSTSPDEWYELTLGSDSDVTISLCNSGYDTKTYVLESGSLIEVGCNDDACTSPGGGLFRSELFLNLPAGTYLIAVDGYLGEAGPYEINVEVPVPIEVDCPMGSVDEGEMCDDTGVPDITNGGCNSTPAVFSTVACGDTVCGMAWALGGTRDTDWYRIETTDAETSIVQTATAEFSLAMGFIPTVPLGSEDCSTISVIDPFANPAAGDTGSITTPCLPAGGHWFFMGHDAFDLLPCGVGAPFGNDYVSEWACTTPCPAEPCPELGDLDNNGEVGFSDLLILLTNYGPCP